ncbi:hypothetical protein BH09SUM1_BH09SUM1_21280 [soil metagenome]
MAEASLSPILSGLSGALGGFVFRRTRDGLVVSGAPGHRAAGSSPQQVIAERILAAVSRAWGAAGMIQRAAWVAYAEEFFPAAPDGRRAALTGQAVFTKVNFYRMAVGMDIEPAAPSAPPAPAPDSVTSLPTGDDSTLKIAVAHSLATVAGYRLFVEVTPSILSPSQPPRWKALHAAAGLNPASFPPLQPTGAIYTIAPLRTPLTATLRFGLRATILTPECVPGAALMTALLHD